MKENVFFRVYKQKVRDHDMGLDPLDFPEVREAIKDGRLYPPARVFASEGVYYQRLDWAHCPNCGRRKRGWRADCPALCSGCARFFKRETRRHGLR